MQNPLVFDHLCAAVIHESADVADLSLVSNTLAALQCLPVSRGQPLFRCVALPQPDGPSSPQGSGSGGGRAMAAFLRGSPGIHATCHRATPKCKPQPPPLNPPPPLQGSRPNSHPIPT